MPIERRTITSRAEWLEWRKSDVTASVVDAVCPGSDQPYTTIARLNAEKRGVVFPERDHDDPLFRRGRILEAAMPAAIKEVRPQWVLKQSNVYLRDPDLNLGCTPDFEVHGDPRGLGVLQAKSALPHIIARDWDNGKEAPRWIVFQTLTEMMLSGAAFGVIAVLAVDSKLELHLIDVPRHPAAEAKIRDCVRRFWDDVEAGRDPPLDFSRDSETITALFNKETAGKTLDVTGHNSLPEILAQRAALRARMKQDEQRCDAIENEIKCLLGDAETVTGLPSWRITFKSSERAGYSVPAKKLRTLRIYDRRPLDEQPGGSDAAEGD